MADFVAFDEPGWTKYLTEFTITALDDGCLLTTETRGRSTNASARRRFRAYWVLIRAGSGLIRRDMLAVTRRHAEARRPRTHPHAVPPHPSERPIS